jgi:hypothetical protein
MTLASFYATDFFTWTQQQAAMLRDGKFDALDLANLAEEIESLGIAQRNKVHSHFRRLLQHLLKWQYQPLRRSPSWRRTIITQRLEIAKEIGTRGALFHQRALLMHDAYPGARRLTETDTGLPLMTFPEACPWTVDQVLDEDFWPDAPPKEESTL